MMSVPGHVTPLRLSQRAEVDLVRGCPPRVLVEADWLGLPVTLPADSATPGVRRYLTDLSLPVRDHSPRLTFRKAAYVDLGEARRTPEGCEMEISWQSSSLAPLFPVFAGRLRVTSSEITLEGYYAPPGGEVGAVLDRAFLNIAARGTARWLLERIVAALAYDMTAEPERGAPPSPSSSPGSPPTSGSRSTLRGRATV